MAESKTPTCANPMIHASAAQTTAFFVEIGTKTPINSATFISRPLSFGSRLLLYFTGQLAQGPNCEHR